VDINFEKIPFLQVIPEKTIIKNQQIKSFTASFCPQKMGRYQKKLSIKFIDSSFSVPIIIKGNCTRLGKCF